MAVDRALLQGRWLHSHEEDQGDTRVYRPSSYQFPRSRGRSGFELRPDGSMIDLGIAPGDGTAKTQGRWSLDDDTLVLEAPGQAARRIRVSALERDRLVTSK
jgi:hypothetical protein